MGVAGERTSFFSALCSCDQARRALSDGDSGRAEVTQELMEAKLKQNVERRPLASTVQAMISDIQTQVCMLAHARANNDRKLEQVGAAGSDLGKRMRAAEAHAPRSARPT